MLAKVNEMNPGKVRKCQRAGKTWGYTVKNDVGFRFAYLTYALQMTNRIPQNGYAGPFPIYDIPIYIHWTFPVGGTFVAFSLGTIAWKTVIPLVLAYTTLILVHELGHAFAAKIISSKVHAILVTAAGGWCFADAPCSFRARLAYHAGGIIAQMMALGATAILVALFGNPSSLVQNCFVFVFTIVNLILIIINIIPAKGTDGEKLWGLLKEHLNSA